MIVIPQVNPGTLCDNCGRPAIAVSVNELVSEGSRYLRANLVHPCRCMFRVVDVTTRVRERRAATANVGGRVA